MSGLLSVSDVTCTSPGGTVLLRDVSFQVNKADILAIAGPNGAGKTTLLNALCGIAQPANGCIKIAEQNLYHMPIKERARLIAVVSQQDVPDGRLTLRDYVGLGQIPIQTKRSAAEHAVALAQTLEVTGLTLLANQRMSVLSGGERQRAHIARALAQDPSILFLDEPTNHLDPDAKGRMLSLVAGLGITVIMVLHDLVLIPEFASHAALLSDARMVSFGPAHDVLTPKRVKETFGVDYLQFQQGNRTVAALDIRNTFLKTEQRNTIQ